MNEFDNNSRDREEVATVGSSALLLVIGWVSAVLSLIAYPFIFGVVGVIMGVLSTKNQSRAGLYLIIFSIIFMGIGLIYGGVFMNYIRHYMGI